MYTPSRHSLCKCITLSQKILDFLTQEEPLEGFHGNSLLSASTNTDSDNRYFSIGTGKPSSRGYHAGRTTSRATPHINILELRAVWYACLLSYTRLFHQGNSEQQGSDVLHQLTGWSKIPVFLRRGAKVVELVHLTSDRNFSSLSLYQASMLQLQTLLAGP